ncbi:MAG: hypothetical protein ABI883_05940 [Chthoniobacterales bacterium]
MATAQSPAHAPADARSQVQSLPFYTLLRVGTIGAVVALLLSTRGNPGLYRALVLSVGFGHYALSVIYAKGPIRRVLTSSRLIALFLGLALLSCAFYAQGLSLLVLFGMHHVFNEVYLPDRSVRLTDHQLVRNLRGARLGLNFFLFFFLVRHDPESPSWNHSLLGAGLVASAVAVAWLMWRIRNQAPRAVWRDLTAFEVAGLLVVPLSFVYQIRFLDVVLYHFVFWALYPIPRMLERGAASAGNYLGLNLLLTGVFFLLSPASPVLALFADATWSSHFRFWSYFHILTAFALSTAFPVWITRCFQSARALPQ